MKKRSVVGIIASVCCLVGCQAVPDEVKQSAEKYHDNEVLQDIEITRCGVDELEQKMAEALELLPDNMVLPEKVDVSGIIEIAEIELKYKRDFLEEKDKVAAAFGITNPTWQVVETAIVNNNMKEYEDAEQKESLTVSDNGFFGVVLGEIYDTFSKEESTSLSHMYNLSQTALNGEACILDGEKVTIESQIDYVEEWLKTQTSILESDFTYQVEAVAVRDTDTANQLLLMLVDKSYNGIRLDDCGGELETTGEQTILKSVGSEFFITLAKKDSIGFFSTGSGMLQVENKTVQQEFIDPASAVLLVEKEISGFRTLEIEDIRIIYRLEPIYDGSINGANDAAPGGGVVAHPAYCFLISRDYEDGGIAAINVGSRYYYIYVDMITGEVKINLDMNAYKQG